MNEWIFLMKKVYLIKIRYDFQFSILHFQLLSAIRYNLFSSKQIKGFSLLSLSHWAVEAFVKKVIYFICF